MTSPRCEVRREKPERAYGPTQAATPIAPSAAGTEVDPLLRLMRHRATSCGLNRLQRLWPLGLVALGLPIAANLPGVGVRFNWTASTPVGFYLQRPLQLTRGELVLLCLPPGVEALGRHRGYLPAGQCGGGSSPVLKKLVGLPGDTIAFAASLLAVNGEVLACSPTHASDGAGRPLAHVPFGSRVLPPGEVWVLGVNPARSWDSRYFGAIPIESLRASVLPLLTTDLGYP